MCTPSPRSGCPRSAGGRQERSGEASRVSSSTTPAGPSTTTSASSSQVGLLVRRRADHEAGQAVGAQRADGLEGLDVAEVVAAEDDAGGLLLRHEGAHRLALVHVAGADLDDVAAGLDAEVVALGELRDRTAQPLEGGGGVVHPPGVHGDGETLLLDEGVGRVRPCAGLRGARARRSRDRPEVAATGCAGRSPTTARCRTARRRRALPRGRASRCRARRGHPSRRPGGRAAR